MKEKESLTNQYTSFMGAWFGGSFVGYIIFKIIMWILVIWGISVLLPGVVSPVLVFIIKWGVIIFALRSVCAFALKKIDKEN